MDLLPAPDDVSLTGFLRAARDAGASDLHVAAGAIPYARVEGEMRRFDLPALEPVRAAEIRDVVLRLAGGPPPGLDQDLCIETAGLGRFRVCVHEQRNGSALSFKCLPRQLETLEELGLPETLYELTRFRVGLVLVTGPSNAGKSTTLASLIQRVNTTRAEHVVTIEEPIEFVFRSELASITQRQVGTHTDSYPAALRAALREDPDVILVSELRDLETIRTALVAAETGHLVLGTLHTRDAISTISRILDVFPPKDLAQVRTLLAGSLRAVISQRLLPAADGGRRVAAYEVLQITPAVAAQIRDGRVHQIASALQTGRRRGMIDLDACLTMLVQEGRLTPEVALSAAKDPSRFGGGR